MIAHTAASRLLREDERVNAWVASTCEDMWPAATRVVDALERWPGGEEPNETVSCALVFCFDISVSYDG